MILLNEITIKNFLSHEDTSLTFKEAEKLLVDGKSGSGKSTITEGIIWALYGKARSDNRSLVRRGSKNGASVSLKFEDQETSYIITRTISATGKNGLTVTKKTPDSKRFLPIERVGVKDIQDWIEQEFLKASYELFTNSIAYPQENENSFVKATASRRKDLLLEIVRAGNFDTLYEKTKKTLNQKQVDSAVTLNNIKNLENIISKSNEVVGTLETSKADSALVSSQIDTINMVEKSLEGQISNINQISSQVSTNKKIKQILESSIEKSKSQISLIEESITKHKIFDFKKAQLDITEIEALTNVALGYEKEIRDISNGQQIINAHLSNRPNVFDYSRDIADINSRLIVLMKENGRCPAGDKCPFLLTVKGQIEYLSEQLEDKAKKTIVEEDAYKKWENQGKLLPVIKDINVFYKSLKDVRDRIEILSVSKESLKRYQDFEESIIGLNTQIGNLRAEIDQSFIELTVVNNSLKELENTLTKFDINKVNSDLSSLRISKQDLQKRLDLATLNIALATNAKKAIEESSLELVRLQNAVIDARVQSDSLELLKEALSPRGIKAVIIDYLVPQLEERINTVLEQMSDFRIRLDTQKATVDDEGIKEGLFITVLNDRNEELPFDSYSGGEKVKITIAISEALASLLSSVGFRIMDENIVSLDKESTTNFVTVLEKLQDKFPQLLVISHLQEVKDIFEKKLTVVKINGISKII